VRKRLWIVSSQSAVEDGRKRPYGSSQ